MSLRDRACRKCGKEYTVQAWFASLRRGVRGRAAQPIMMTCPGCQRAVPATEVQCPRCGADLTVEAAFDQTLEPVRAWWQRFADGLGPRARHRIRWGYLLLSLFLLWEVLGYAEARRTSEWLLHAALCVAYLGVFLFLFVWLTPREPLRKFARQAPRPVKLALVCNYFTLLMLLQIAIGTWWTRATMLAVLFAVTWGGFKVFADIIHPRYRELLDILFGDSDPRFDPSAPHGRKGRVG